MAGPREATRRGAAVIAEHARAAVADRGRCSVAVSGGSGPWPMFEALAEHRLDWDRLEIFQVDERVAPEGDPDRNVTHLARSLPAEAASSIRPMPVSDDDLEAAAARYAQSLPARLDLVHLGLGRDGHTASLVPGDPVLAVRDRLVAVTAEYAGRRRMTLTYPALDAARSILWLVTGDSKHEALAKLRGGDDSIPAGQVKNPRALVLCDEAAAGGGDASPISA